MGFICLRNGTLYPDIELLEGNCGETVL